MNQILATKPVKQRKNVNLKTVVLFFGICMIIFGVCMVSSGSYAMYISKSTRTSSNGNNTSNSNNVQPNNSEIQIHLSVDGANIKASIIGETEISFVTYKWDDEEEEREDINNVSGDVSIEIPEGDHTLTVTAVDINNNTKTESKQVRGIVSEGNQSDNNNQSKPKLEVRHEGNEFVIDASDEKGLDKFEFILNGQGFRVRVEGEKEKQFKYPLIEGDNTLEVTVYNIDGATETFKALIHN